MQKSKYIFLVLAAVLVANFTLIDANAETENNVNNMVKYSEFTANDDGSYSINNLDLSNYVGYTGKIIISNDDLFDADIDISSVNILADETEYEIENSDELVFDITEETSKVTSLQLTFKDSDENIVKLARAPALSVVESREGLKISREGSTIQLSSLEGITLNKIYLTVDGSYEGDTITFDGVEYENTGNIEITDFTPKSVYEIDENISSFGLAYTFDNGLNEQRVQLTEEKKGEKAAGDNLIKNASFENFSGWENRCFYGNRFWGGGGCEILAQYGHRQGIADFTDWVDINGVDDGHINGAEFASYFDGTTSPAGNTGGSGPEAPTFEHELALGNAHQNKDLVYQDFLMDDICPGNTDSTITLQFDALVYGIEYAPDWETGGLEVSLKTPSSSTKTAIMPGTVGLSSGNPWHTNLQVTIPYQPGQYRIGFKVPKNSWYTIDQVSLVPVDCQTTDTGAVTVDKAVTDASGDNKIQPGEVATYTISVHNTKTSTVTDAVLKDTMTEITQVFDVNDSTVININGSPSGYTIGNLKSGITYSYPTNSTTTFTFNVTAKSTIPTTFSTVSNTATISNGSNIDDSGTASISTDPVVEPVGDVTFTKYVNMVEGGDNLVDAGETARYELVIENNSNMDQTFTVTDQLTSNLGQYFVVNPTNVFMTLSDVPNPGSGEIAGLGVDYIGTLAELESGYSVTVPSGENVDIVFDLPAKSSLPVQTIIRNTATIKNDYHDKTAFVDITTGGSTGLTNVSFDLSVIEPSNSYDGILYPGEMNIYKASITNRNNSPQDVVFTNNTLGLLGDYYYIDGSGEVTVKTLTTTTKITQADINAGYSLTLPANETVNIYYVIQAKSVLPSNTNVVNTAKVTADGQTLSDSTTLVTPVNAVDDLVISLDVVDESGNGTLEPNENATYTINVVTKANGGTFKVSAPVTSELGAYYDIPSENNVVKIDELGAATRYVSIADLESGISFNSDTAKTIKLTFTLPAKSSLPSSVEISNTAYAKSGLRVKSDTASIRTSAEPVITANINKTVTDEDGDGYAQPDEYLTYNISGNYANVVNTQLTISDIFSTNVDSSKAEMISVKVDDVPLSSSEYTTQINEGSYWFKTVAAVDGSGSFEISYKVPVLSDVADGDTVQNFASIVSGDGQFDDAVISVKLPESTANAQKLVNDENSDLYASPGEKLSYVALINFSGLNNEPFIIEDDFDQNIDASTLSIDQVYVNRVGTSDYTLDVNSTDSKMTITSNSNYTGDVEVLVTYSANVKEFGDVAGDPVYISNTVTAMSGDEVSATAQIPYRDPGVQLTKTVSDDNGNGLAQGGEELTYSIEYVSSADADQIIITDNIGDANLSNSTPRNLRIMEDDVILPASRYTIDQVGTVFTVTISGVKANSDYDILFNIDVNDDIVSEEVVNTVKEEVSGEQNEAVISTSTLPYNEVASISKTATENAAGDGDGKADLGEYIDYEINFASNKSHESLNIYDDLTDLNLESDSVKDLKVYMDGNLLSTSEYTYTNTADQMLISIPNYIKSHEVKITFSVQVVAGDRDATKITNTAGELNSGASDSVDMEIDSDSMTQEKEEVEKTVVGSSNVAPGDEIQYRMEIESLKNDTTSLTFVDEFRNEYLDFVSVDGVYLDDIAINPDSWSNAGSAILNTTINRNITAGTKVTIFYTAKLADDTPVNISVGNSGYVQTPDVTSNADVAYVSTGLGTVDPNGNIYTEKMVTHEGGSAVSGQVEPGETITYQILIENVSSSDVSVNVQDDLVAQQLDKVFNWHDDDTLFVNGVSGSYEIADLQAGIDMVIPANSRVLISYNLIVKETIGDMDIYPEDGNIDDLLLNTAKVTELGKASVYPGVTIRLPFVNGDMYFIKTSTTLENDDLEVSSYSDFPIYNLKAVSYSDAPIYGITVQDDLVEQGFADYFDLSAPEEYNVIVEDLEGNPVETEPAEPTLADLMGDGITFDIPAGVGNTVITKFMLTPRTDIAPKEVFEGGIKNIGSATDPTHGKTITDDAKIYLGAPVIEDLEYSYIPADDIPILIPGMDMENRLTTHINEDMNRLVADVQFDTRYLNKVHQAEVTINVNGVPIMTEGVIQDQDLSIVFSDSTQGANLQRTTMDITYPFKAGDDVEIIATQQSKESFNDQSYSVNAAKIYTDVAETNRQTAYYTVV